MLRFTSGSRSLGAPADLLGAPWLGQAGPDLANIYLHARYYDSVLGVFLSPDRSHPLDAGVGLNRYAYGMVDPVNEDPSGNSCVVLDGQAYCTDGTTVFGSGGDTSGYGLIEGLGDGAGDRRNRDAEQREREAEKQGCGQGGVLGECPGAIPTPTQTCEELGNCPVQTCEELGTCPVNEEPKQGDGEAEEVVRLV